MITNDLIQSIPDSGIKIGGLIWSTSCAWDFPNVFLGHTKCKSNEKNKWKI